MALKPVCLKASSGLMADPWRDSGSGRAGFWFCSFASVVFHPILCPPVVVVEFKEPFPKLASNMVNAVRSRWCSGSAFEVVGKDVVYRGEALQSKAVASSSSTCCFFISGTVCVGIQVQSLLTGWCFLTRRWSEAKGWSGNGCVQLGSD